VFVVLASDKEGAILCRAQIDSWKDKKFDNSFGATFATANEQAAKLQLGAHRMIVSMYDNVMLLHCPLGVVLLTFIASPDVNVQKLVQVSNDLKQRMQPIREQISHREND